MKIGVYGGSFNPCHLVHKKIVLTLLERQGFDYISLWEVIIYFPLPHGKDMNIF